MPKCKNNPKKTYKGTEPSPKGKGWCAGGMEEGVTKKGTDGNKWIVSADKNGNKRWKKDTKTKSKTASTTKSTTKSKTKSPDKSVSPVDSRPIWKKALGYLFNGKTTYIDPDKPLYIRITPTYYIHQWAEEKDGEGWSDGGTHDFKFTKNNKPSNKDIVKFWKKKMFTKKNKGLIVLSGLTFKFTDVYTVGNKIEYKFKCMSDTHPTNGHILKQPKLIGRQEHRTGNNANEFIKVGKQQVWVSVFDSKMYQK